MKKKEIIVNLQSIRVLLPEDTANRYLIGAATLKDIKKMDESIMKVLKKDIYIESVECDEDN